MNEYDVEIGLTQRELDSEIGGLYRENDDYGGFYYHFKKESIENENLIPISGIRRVADDLTLIYNNGYPQVYEAANNYGDFGEELYEYNEDDSAIYKFYYDAPGDSKYGLWSTNENKWIILPEYNNIIQSSQGFTGVKKTVIIEGDLSEDEFGYKLIRSTNYSPLSDSNSLDIFSNDFKLVKTITDLDEFMGDPDHFKYLVNLPQLGNCVNYPRILNPENYLYDARSNYWFENEDGYVILSDNIFTYEARIIASGLDWLHESEGYTYGLTNDTLLINYSGETWSSIQVAVGKTFELKEFSEGIAFTTNNTTQSFKVIDGKIVIAQEEITNEIKPNTFIQKRKMRSMCKVICQITFFHM